MIWDIREKNIKIFEETRKFSNETISSLTQEMVHNTQVYEDCAEQLDASAVKKRRQLKKQMNASFSSRGTVNTAYDYLQKEGIRVAMLNFADALTPGGLVLSGEVTQEENICRCTNLYESLISENAQKGYYNRNRANERERRTYGYTNALIYSPHVAIFREDESYQNREIRFADVITSPSPCGGNTRAMEKLIEKRIRGIVLSAVQNQADILILGAWGCGAFGQNPEVMAGIFGKVLSEYKDCFDTVDFAIRGNTGGESPLLPVFQEYFFREYH